MKHTIHFVDNGQDFLEWDLDHNGVVVDCRPCQASVWNGTKVLNRLVEPLMLLDIECNDGQIRILAHRVESIYTYAFYGKTYLYPTPSNGERAIGVCRGLGGDSCIVAWIAHNGARKRIKTIRLPVMDDPARLQGLLDTWAAGRGLKEVAQ